MTNNRIPVGPRSRSKKRKRWELSKWNSNHFKPPLQSPWNGQATVRCCHRIGFLKTCIITRRNGVYYNFHVAKEGKAYVTHPRPVIPTFFQPVFLLWHRKESSGVPRCIHKPWPWPVIYCYTFKSNTLYYTSKSEMNGKSQLCFADECCILIVLSNNFRPGDVFAGGCHSCSPINGYYAVIKCQGT